jgi:hypothetical protein
MTLRHVPKTAEPDRIATGAAFSASRSCCCRCSSSTARGMHARTLLARFTVVAQRPPLFLFRPRPALHAAASLRRASLARCTQRSGTRAPSAQSTTCRSRPPRGVTVFAEREDKPGASGPQKQRRHFTPSHRLWFHSSRLHVPLPMRRHAACSGSPYRARTSLAGKRRAGAPVNAL